MTTKFGVLSGLRGGVALAIAIALGGAALPHAQRQSATPVAGEADAGILVGRWGDDTTNEDEKASEATGRWQAPQDRGSLHSIASTYGAQAAWKKLDSSGRTITGKGVDVAVIDTGIAPVAGLDAAGKVVNGPDLSFESQAANTRHIDGYGHGTHMAGIIAGRDREVLAGAENDPSRFVGIAPDARIVSLKVAAADGGADVSQVIAAIDWVVQNRRANGLNIQVINLSYGTRSRQPYTADPLAHAVENAWRHGIAVVTAAGNDGGAVPVTMPATDPYVITVGAVDHVGTAETADDRLASFSNAGTTARRPDLLAPGKSVVSLRTPGSYADVMHPEALVNGDTGRRFFRGSGTSQATAVVSGAVALLLQQRPSLTPDQVKALLKTSADKLATNPGEGPGVIDIIGALDTAAPTVTGSRQTWPASTGIGALEAARGESHVVDPANGAALTGEFDALGAPWQATAWSKASAAATAWSGSGWNGSTWDGTWTGRSWSGIDWQARSWSGDVWFARSWSGIDFVARSWSGKAWA